MTLEILARMVSNGFSDMQKQMDKRFDAVDKRFDKNDSAHAELHSEINAVRKELKEMNVKLDNLSKRTFEDSELAFKEIMQMKKRLTFLEKEIEKMKLSH